MRLLLALGCAAVAALAAFILGVLVGEDRAWEWGEP